MENKQRETMKKKETVEYLRLWSKSCYKRFEAFNGPIRRKNFANCSIKKRFKTFIASR